MWTSSEIKDIDNLLDKSVELKDFLSQDEIDVIKGDDDTPTGENRNIVRFKNLRNTVFAPKKSEFAVSKKYCK